MLGTRMPWTGWHRSDAGEGYAVSRTCSECEKPSEGAICGDCEFAAEVNSMRGSVYDRIRADAMAERTREVEKAFRDHGRQWDEMARRLVGSGGGFTQAQAEAKARHYHDAADYVMNRHPEAFPQPETAK